MTRMPAEIKATFIYLGALFTLIGLSVTKIIPFSVAVALVMVIGFILFMLTI